jgi:hypothetical protein
MQTAPNNRALSALQYSDNQAFVRKCQAALKKHRGHRARAAKELDVTVRTLLRWCAKYPAILKDLDLVDAMYKPTKEEAMLRAKKRQRTLGKLARAS